MLRRRLLIAGVVALVACPGAGASSSLGLPWAGRLVHGVELASSGPHFRTWDPLLHRRPDRPDRRWGNRRLVRDLLHVLARYAAAHPQAPPVLVGDLSRPHGGPFGPRHVSHRNGLDADVYYPRLDRRGRPADTAAQVDRRLAQELVTRFVRAGAERIFVGPDTGLAGPPGVVQVLAGHDTHLHVRIHADPPRRVLLGRSEAGRQIPALELGNRGGRPRILVVGCIHGTECTGTAVTSLLARTHPFADLWLVPDLNPDGRASGTRQDARGVDLNRNFPAMWKPIGRRGDPQYAGPRALSERETRIARALILRLRPDVTIWFHQPQAVVRAWGPSIPTARRYAALAGVPFRALPWPNGTAPNWQNHRFPHAASFVVELPAGPLDPAAAARYASAVLRLER